MNEQRKGLITFESGRGWYFCEDLDDCFISFVHMKQSMDSRQLHLNDIITYKRVDSTRVPGKFDALEVRYSGHRVASQVSAPRGGGQ